MPKPASICLVLVLVAGCHQDSHESAQRMISRMRAERAQFVARCLAYRQEMARAVAAGGPLPKPLHLDSSLPKWELDPVTHEFRTIVKADGFRFAFPHDSVQMSPARGFDLYYRLPQFVPRAELYCDPEHRPGPDPIPGTNAVDVHVHVLRPLHPYQEDQEFAVPTDAGRIESTSIAEWGLERHRTIHRWARTTYVPIAPGPAGSPRLIDCHQVTNPSGPEAGRLDCRMRFRYRDDFGVELEFDESQVGHWQAMTSMTTAALEEAFRGKD